VRFLCSLVTLGLLVFPALCRSDEHATRGWLEIIETTPLLVEETKKPPRKDLPVLDRPSENAVSPVLELDGPDEAVESAQSIAAAKSAYRQPLTENVDMFVGEVKVLGRVSVDRVAVGNGSVIQVEVLDEGDLLVIAEAPGSSSIRLWHKDGTQSDFNVWVGEYDPQPRFPAKRMITMRVKMVEFRKSALEELGINWSDNADGPTIATAGDVWGNPLYRPDDANDSQSAGQVLPNMVSPFSGYAGIASSLTSRINLMTAAGDAQILAEPVLSCASGETASFLAGGEVPYPSTGSDGQPTIEFKSYGIKLEVAPLIDTQGNVLASITTEISSLDPSVSVQGAPGLLTRRAKTRVTIAAGETIVIAGLLQIDKGRDRDAVPGLGRLPWLGSLFRSTRSRSGVSELVIFITPEINDGSVDLSERHQQVLQKTRKWIQNVRSGQWLNLLE